MDTPFLKKAVKVLPGSLSGIGTPRSRLHAEQRITAYENEVTERTGLYKEAKRFLRQPAGSSGYDDADTEVYDATVRKIREGQVSDSSAARDQLLKLANHPAVSKILADTNERLGKMDELNKIKLPGHEEVLEMMLANLSVYVQTTDGCCTFDDLLDLHPKKLAEMVAYEYGLRPEDIDENTKNFVPEEIHRGKDGRYYHKRPPRRKPRPKRYDDDDDE